MYLSTNSTVLELYCKSVARDILISMPTFKVFVVGSFFQFYSNLSRSLSLQQTSILSQPWMLPAVPACVWISSHHHHRHHTPPPHAASTRWAQMTRAPLRRRLQKSIMSDCGIGKCCCSIKNRSLLSLELLKWRSFCLSDIYWSAENRTVCALWSFFSTFCSRNIGAVCL